VVAATAAVPVTPVAAQGSGGFRNGEAEAAASTFGVSIIQGNANIGFTYGRALANYRDVTGTADAKALDLGVLPTLFGVEQCDGSAPILNPATFPPSTRVDSTEANAATPRAAVAHLPGFGSQRSGPPAGEQEVSATRAPSASATTRSERADLLVITVEGGATEVTTRLSGGVREARAVTTAKRLRVFGELFTFVNPRWEAVARSGASTTTEGSFTFERATVLGQPRSAQQVMGDLEAFRRGLEQLLAPLGVKLTLPAVEITDGRVRVTPMTFAVRDMPWGAQVLAPFLGNIQPLREVLTRLLLEEDCRSESSLLLADTLLGILSGSGSVELTAGGVEASTADTDFSSPPLPEPPVDRTVPPPVEVADETLTPELPPLDDEFGDLGFDDTSFDTTDSFDSSLGAEPTFSAADEDDRNEPEEELAAAALPAASVASGDAGTAAVAVGAAGLAAALALSMAERLRARRMSRRIP
jgi:hypothetical protein